MKEKYDATYHFGKVVVHVVAPPSMTGDEIQMVLDNYRATVWEWWDGLTTEEKLRINAELEAEADGQRGVG